MGDRTGYGTALYGTGKYGYPEVFTGTFAVSVTSSVTQADAIRIKIGAATDSSSVSVTATPSRTLSYGSTASASSSATTTANVDVSAAAAPETSLSVSLLVSRVMPFSASTSVTSLVSQREARTKWIEQTNLSETWTEADYRGD
jgi:hypothetical protein